MYRIKMSSGFDTKTRIALLKIEIQRKVISRLPFIMESSNSPDCIFQKRNQYFRFNLIYDNNEPQGFFTYLTIVKHSHTQRDTFSPSQYPFYADYDTQGHCYHNK